ncbi:MULTISPECIES: ABC transporter permease [unclassified Bacillus (in: firmicutes)]|uniref:ABC transporter permease n=1 Tax=unclassified Bacillus (in: firmicutes) TaxID=185979 RepID=UPI0008EFE071|nr:MULTISPECIES: ABC transporter permease [unclassified Bacillus (in: firmicutes)]SFI94625.1 ABC-2 type transport system permease protein [Bacillus sp. 71mf]SFS64966.1 ABC-2 type transport system permease protein [Bacillus sp. 103mf]
MMKLIQNEFLKLHAKKSMYILLVVLAALEIAEAVILKKWAPPELKIEGFMMFAEQNIGMIATFATIFGITLASHTITEEFQKGTIKQLLIRPRKRVMILFSKYITVLLAILLVCIVSLFTAMLIGLIAFGGDTGMITFAILLKRFAYNILPILFYPTVAFLLANIFRKSVLPLVITLFFFFLESMLKMLIFQFGQGIAKYVVMFHLNLNMYDSNELLSQGAKPIFSEFSFTTSLLFVLAHFAVLLVASSALFQKRDVL